MNITLTSLEALVLKATHEALPCPDAAAMEAFCAVMRDSADGSQYAAQALAARIHTPNAREAMLALTMLDRCMRRCDANFHAEIGKFRFLNEMIKLVSPKYFADRTAPEVRTRVLQLLHAWSIEYPKESKFKVAYDMLKNQGVIKETPPPLPPENSPPPLRPRPKCALYEDDAKSKLLQRLLQSKKPEDLQHANRLIKTMVREEERRNEASSRRAHEVGAAMDSAGLLRDMLEHAQDASPDDIQLIRELQTNCMRQLPVLQSLASSETHDDDIGEIIQALDVLDEVFVKYNAFLSENKEKITSPVNVAVNNNDTLLDFAGSNPSAAVDSTKKAKTNVIDELGDIFSSGSGSNTIAEPLKPVSLIPAEESDLLGDKKSKAEGWNELDSLGEELLKKSLPENAKHAEGFNGKSTRKIPMNALEKQSPKHEPQLVNHGPVFDLDFFIKKPEEKPLTPQIESPKDVTPNDDVMVDISTDGLITSTNSVSNNNDRSPLHDILDLSLTLDNNAKCDKTENSVVNKEYKAIVENERNDIVKNNKSEVKPLTDINVTLQSVHPSKVPPMTAFEEEGGISVVLHFCRDKPRSDVNVIVISTTSKNPMPIDDYKFQSIVPKGCKVRLLTASGSCLPAYNPFLPPPALTQVMLIARPEAARVNLKFVITYTCNDDTCSEIGEVPELPLDNVQC